MVTMVSGDTLNLTVSYDVEGVVVVEMDDLKRRALDHLRQFLVEYMRGQGGMLTTKPPVVMASVRAVKRLIGGEI